MWSKRSATAAARSTGQHGQITPRRNNITRNPVVGFAKITQNTGSSARSTGQHGQITPRRNNITLDPVVGFAKITLDHVVGFAKITQNTGSCL